MHRWQIQGSICMDDRSRATYAWMTDPGQHMHRLQIQGRIYAWMTDPEQHMHGLDGRSAYAFMLSCVIIKRTIKTIFQIPTRTGLEVKFFIYPAVQPHPLGCLVFVCHLVT